MYYVLVSKQLDTIFLMYLFHFSTYCKQQCWSSGESNCINTSSGVYHSV